MVDEPKVVPDQWSVHSQLIDEGDRVILFKAHCYNGVPNKDGWMRTEHGSILEAMSNLALFARKCNGYID